MRFRVRLTRFPISLRHSETPLPHGPAIVREPEEVEGFGTPLPLRPAVRHREPSELDQAGNFGCRSSENAAKRRRLPQSRRLTLLPQSRRLTLGRAVSCTVCLPGAPRETRTPDPLITNQVLYQLSYRGTTASLATAGQMGKPVRAARNLQLLLWHSDSIWSGLNVRIRGTRCRSGRAPEGWARPEI